MKFYNSHMQLSERLHLAWSHFNCLRQEIVHRRSTPQMQISMLQHATAIFLHITLLLKCAGDIYLLRLWFRRLCELNNKKHTHARSGKSSVYHLSRRCFYCGPFPLHYLFFVEVRRATAVKYRGNQPAFWQLSLCKSQPSIILWMRADCGCGLKRGPAIAW